MVKARNGWVRCFIRVRLSYNNKAIESGIKDRTVDNTMEAEARLVSLLSWAERT